jgi:hypothetical protein
VALGKVFSEYFCFLCQFSFHRLFPVHHLSSGDGTIGQLVADVPRGLSRHNPRNKNKKYIKAPLSWERCGSYQNRDSIFPTTSKSVRPSIYPLPLRPCFFFHTKDTITEDLYSLLKWTRESIPHRTKTVTSQECARPASCINGICLLSRYTQRDVNSAIGRQQSLDNIFNGAHWIALYYLSIYGFTALCWTLVAFFSFLNYYTVGGTPSTGDKPVARPLPAHRTAKHRINAHRHPCLKWYTNPRTQCLSRRRQFRPWTAQSLWSANNLYYQTCN